MSFIWQKKQVKKLLKSSAEKCRQKMPLQKKKEDERRKESNWQVNIFVGVYAYIVNLQ